VALMQASEYSNNGDSGYTTIPSGGRNLPLQETGSPPF